MKKNQMMQRILCAFLTVLMIGTAIACTNESGQKPTDETTAKSEETTERPWLDDLPDKMDYHGLTITFKGLSEGIFAYSGDTKEVISKAQYDKCMNVIERMNIKPVFFAGKDTFGKDDLQQAVDSGIADFDLMLGRGKSILSMAFEGYVIDMAEQEEFSVIDLDAEWWAADFVREVNVGDKVFWLVGNISDEMEYQAYCIFTNMSMLPVVAGNEFSIYDTVREGKWTLDTLAELTRQAYLDDGDGVRSENDRYGFRQQADHFIDVFGICAGAKYSKRDENNMPYSVISSETNVTINEKLYDLVHMDGTLRDVDAGGNFGKGQVLFYAECTDVSGMLRNMQDDWTMIPMPKWSEDQEEYLTTLHETFGSAGIPVTTSSELYEPIFTLLELSAAEYRRLVRPAILDEAMKNKYSRDEDTKEMVDLVTAHVTTDFLIVYADNTGVGHLFSDNCYQTRDIASNLARKEKGVGKTIENFISKLD